jgi:hypothetical protein
MSGIELKSAAFSDHAPIPSRYTKDGDDVSPPLVWSGVPEDTKELVLLCEDPDAPAGSFTHWLVTGIDPRSGGVDTGQLPPGGEPKPNGFGNPGWGGPRPPAGDPAHRYFFRLYAVSEPLPLPDQPSAKDVHDAMAGRQQASGTLVGVYQR